MRRAVSTGRISRNLPVLAVVIFTPILARAQQLVPTFGSSAGQISAVASAQIANDEFVTAVRNSSGDLEIIEWWANLQTSQLVRIASVNLGPVSAISITSESTTDTFYPGVFVTAAINANGNLDVISWLAPPNGPIMKITEIEGDPASAVSVSTVTFNLFLTAIRNGSGNLEISSWYLNYPSWTITQGGTTYAGAISQVAAVGLAGQYNTQGGSGFAGVTAVLNSWGALELIDWNSDYSGNIGRGPTAYSGEFSQIAAALAVNPGNTSGPFYTAGLMPNGQVEVTSWGVNNSSNSITTGASAFGYVAKQVAICAANPAAFTGAIYTDGTLYVQAWDTIGNSFEPVALAFVPGLQTASEVSVTPVDLSSPNAQTFAVSFRNSAGNLQIQLFNYLPVCSPNCS